jgi:cell division protein FtsA
VFVDGAIRHTAVLALGGHTVSNDIAIGLRVPVDRAEQVKLEQGCALVSMVKEGESVRIPSVAGRPPREIRRDLLVSMIEPRMEEILCLALKEARKTAANDLLGGGVVLTGGTSMMPGLPELAEQIFDLPARRGVPSVGPDALEGVEDPRQATGVGLLHHAMRDGARAASDRGIADRVAGQFRRWVGSFFS